MESFCNEGSEDILKLIIWMVKEHPLLVLALGSTSFCHPYTMTTDSLLSWIRLLQRCRLSGGSGRVLKFDPP
jgi:squalene cyclase